VSYIDQHKDQFGVEPICGALQVVSSTYYAARSRPPSARQREDQRLSAEVMRVFESNYRVYGRRKIWAQLNREGIPVGRDRVERLMKQAGIAGAVRGKRVRTTRPDERAPRAPDLVDRDWAVSAPNRVWVSDFTYVATWSGMAYVAFVIDVYSRRIVGWRVASSMRTALVLDALEQAIWARDERLEGLIVHTTPAVNSRPFVSPSAWLRSVRHHRWDRSAIRSTTRSPNRPSGSTRAS